jgi:hypothetical protein
MLAHHDAGGVVVREAVVEAESQRGVEGAGPRQVRDGEVDEDLLHGVLHARPPAA